MKTIAHKEKGKDERERDRRGKWERKRKKIRNKSLFKKRNMFFDFFRIISHMHMESKREKT